MPAPTTEELTFCEVHPDRETSLRCNKCGRLMCVECAVPTPVGYRCKQCVRQHEDKFFNASPNDYAIIAAVCAALTGVGAFIISAIGIWLILTIIAAIPIGGAIGEAALRATGRRRGRYSAQIAGAAALLGGLLGGVIHAYSAIQQALNVAITQLGQQAVPPVPIEMVVNAVVQDIGLLVFVGMVTFFVYSRFKMRG